MSAAPACLPAVTGPGPLAAPGRVRVWLGRRECARLEPLLASRTPMAALAAAYGVPQDAAVVSVEWDAGRAQHAVTLAHPAFAPGLVEAQWRMRAVAPVSAWLGDAGWLGRRVL